MAAMLAQLRGWLDEPVQLVAFLAVNTALNGIFYLGGNKIVGGWVGKQPWWERAIPFQKGMMSNFGYPEAAQTPEAVLETYAFTIVMCMHHSALGLLALPSIIYGWEDGGAVVQLCFYIMALLQLGCDIYDTFRTTILCWCPAVCPCMAPVPTTFWALSLLHHTLSLGTCLPLLSFYAGAWQFHWIAFSMLFAAGFAQGTGAYKFSLNTNDPRDLQAYKLIVVFQTLLIWSARVFVWLYAAISLAQLVRSEGKETIFWIVIVVLVCFSVVNLVIVADCTAAAIKWLPRKVPKTE